MTITFKTRPMDGTDWTTNNGSASGIWTTQSELTASAANLDGTFAGTQSWEVMMIVEDLFDKATYSYPVSTDKVLVAKTKDGIGIGKIREHGALDVDGEIYANNKPIQHHQLTTNDGSEILLAAGTDLNTITKSGYYNGCNFVNAPTGSGANNWKHIRVSKQTYDYGWVLQEAVDFNGIVSAFRVQSDGIWKDWQYYAVQNSIANFTAVNQTKVYSKTIAMPFSSQATVTRVGNQVQFTWNRAASNFSSDYEYVQMAETVPTGYRPVYEVHMPLSGNVANSVGGHAVIHLGTDGAVRMTVAAQGDKVWSGTITYLTSDPFPAE
jgi:hypothetical protein